MSDKHRIDNHKLIFHPQRVSQWLQHHKNWETAKNIYPIYMEISPVGYCNHRCSFCAVDFMGYEHKKLDFEILKQNLTEMSDLGVKSVMFAGEGEPTLHKQLPEIIEHCKDINIDTSLTTNMVPFTEKNTETFVKNCKWIKVSINAGNSETYAKIHNTDKQDFNRVLGNMKLAVSIKKEKNYSCTIGAQMLLLPDNFDTVVELAQKTREAGIDYLVIKPYSQHLSSITKKYKDIDYSEYIHLEEELKKFNSDSFNVIFRKNTIEKLFESDNKYKKCNATPFFWGYITAAGDVYGCSCFLGDKKFCYGNINEKSFQEIWEGEARKDNFEYLRDNMDINNCRKNCRMDEINRYLWELLHPGEHVNFI